MMRKAYSHAAEKAFPKYPAGTYLLLGEMAVQRAKYNMTYPEDISPVLDYIDNWIIENQ